MKISHKIIEKVFSHVSKAVPLEACGYLAGTGDRVIEHYEMTNVDKSHKHYSFDPEEQFAVMKAAREKKIDLIGVYHSHPTTGARPSKEDIRLAYDPNISYVIISLEKEPFDFKSFKITKGLVTPEDVEIL